MDSRDIRQLFTRFFEERGHRRVPSSSLIPPPEERTMLFTTAGMVQMKPYFMGLARPPATRLTSIQKCFRTSDIEEVGDGSHHTFFEMLGNFSVGDPSTGSGQGYFKAEVIAWGWELLTAPQPQGLGLEKSRIWATIYQDDEEAFDLWRSVGVPVERIVRYGEKDNYWFMGGVGPCGPNTEINYDFGRYEGWPEHDCHPNCDRPDCRRFLELWNLVFMTLFQAEDGSRRPLPQRNVDTGAGLERWPAPLLWEGGIDWQGRSKTWHQPPTNYDSDLFRPVLAKIEELSGIKYDAHELGEPSLTYSSKELQYRAMRVVAEHSRAAAFLIADGVLPSNDSRGYVLRRLIRRAIYYGRSVSTDLADVARSVIDEMGIIHPALVEQRSLIERLLQEEEEQFRETMFRGSNELNARLSQLFGFGTTIVPGETAFYLHDTYGFPLELTREIASQRDFEVDEVGFERLMEEQRSRSRAATRFEGDAARVQTYVELGLEHTEFVGYETTRALALVRAIVLDGVEVVRTLERDDAAGRRVEVVLDQTPFYAEGGGQVGDRGDIVWPDPDAARPEALEGRGTVSGQGRFVVEDTQAVGEGGVVVHVGRIESGVLSVGDPVEARVDEDLRADTMRNHTATHILHAALRQVLGSHVRQAGSLVTPDRLRFDFTHLESLTPAQVAEVEALANRVVRENIPVHVEHQSYEEALASGALAFFGDKYAETVRVVGVCDPEADRCFSRELCGGTHVHASGDVGAIIVTAETSIGAGLRRIEAVSGRAATERIRAHEDLIDRLSASLAAPPAEIQSRFAALREENDRLRRELQATQRQMARQAAVTVTAPVFVPEEEAEFESGGIPCVIRRMDVPTADALRAAGDALKARHREVFILLASVIDGKPAFLAMSTPDVAKRCPAGDVVRAAAQAAGGNGGGRPELAQGGGNDPSKIDAALAAGRKVIEDKLRAAN